MKDDTTKKNQILVNHENYFHGRDNRIFCRNKNSIEVPQNCLKCSLFNGSLQGEGVSCIWKDNAQEAFEGNMEVFNPEGEFLRVSQMIDNKEISKDPYKDISAKEWKSID